MKRTMMAGTALLASALLLSACGTAGGGGGGGTDGMPTELGKKLAKELGIDVARVRIHTDATAAKAAAILNAQAFTIGNDIYFAEGQYNPNSEEGIHLIDEIIRCFASGQHFAGLDLLVVLDGREKLDEGSGRVKGFGLFEVGEEGCAEVAALDLDRLASTKKLKGHSHVWAIKPTKNCITKLEPRRWT